MAPWDAIGGLLACELHRTPWHDLGTGDAIYAGFNLAEAAAWLACAVRVGWRGLRRPHGRIAAAYAAAFTAFAITDLIEADALTVGLLLVKGVVLLLILACRRIVVDRLPGVRW
jgi:hypothetical protein